MVSNVLRYPRFLHVSVSVVVWVFIGSLATARESFDGLIRLASKPTLSPDGKTLVVSWAGDLWRVATNGGLATQLTRHPSMDTDPVISPDGSQVAFASSRRGSRQVFVMPVDGSLAPAQLTNHSEGFGVEQWHPDGKRILCTIIRDHGWRYSNSQRFSYVSADPENPLPEEALFDAYGDDPRISPNGKKVLFTREGQRWWRKGYRGSGASQIWVHDLDRADKQYELLLDHEAGSRSPIWSPSGNTFYYSGQRDGVFNLRHRDLETGSERQLTNFDDDSVVSPTISGDGSMMVFTHLFDLYSLRLGNDGTSVGKPKKIRIEVPGDSPRTTEQRRILSKATNVSFSRDGLEIAFIAGGDLWVMDTELREPVQITNSPEDEDEPLFSSDGNSIVFTSDRGGQRDLWKAERGDDESYWWLNSRFTLTRLTDDKEVEYNTAWSPDGKHIAFLRERGDLWLIKPDGTEARQIVEAWSSPSYDWSPDGSWLVCALSDSDFNSDIWLLSIDGSREPFNLSRHPDNDRSPKWSPDGRSIVFTGRRRDGETDIHYVWLRAEDDAKSKRDRTLEKALEKMKKARPPKKKEAELSQKKPDSADEKVTGKDKAAPPEKKGEPAEKGQSEKPKTSGPKSTEIDFDGIHDRTHRISLPGVSESGLFWSHDSKKVAFSAKIDGKEGTYTVEPAGDTKPKLLVAKTGSFPHWVAKGNQVRWLSGGVPGTVSSTGMTWSYTFKVRQMVDLPARFRAAFDECWRMMRDHFYDPELNNRDWDSIRQKYAPMAEQAIDGEALSKVVYLMLGELNASHLGFSYRGPSLAPRAPTDAWTETTAHLGLRFDRALDGPGLMIRDVLKTSPANKKGIGEGERLVSINGTEIEKGAILTELLNGFLNRDIELGIRGLDGKDRQVSLRPISYSAARSLVYKRWVESNRQRVEKASRGRLGYLHIASMNATSFDRFEEELYAAGAGRDGMVIDVRENGGGYTTDHLLTILTQPRHAFTVPRGGSPGYPQDRMVYASWHRPITVLCNQNSFSNAEIFSHAIQSLGRGKVVGVPTAGGVISTGSRSIMDLGSIRLPFRGWFRIDNGEDMELNGAAPEHVIWPQPGQIPAGLDLQLDQAIKVLVAEARRARRQPLPEARTASERRNP